jgi:hypothetical protein
MSQQNTEDVLAQFGVQNRSGSIVDISKLLRPWTAATFGEFIWGKRNVHRVVEVYDENNVLVCVQFMTALHQTFTG